MITFEFVLKTQSIGDVFNLLARLAHEGAISSYNLNLELAKIQGRAIVLTISIEPASNHPRDEGEEWMDLTDVERADKVAVLGMG